MEMGKNKNLVYLILGGAALYLLYKQFNKPKGASGNTGNTGNGGTNPPPPPPPDGANLLRLQKMANELFEAMDGCTTENDKVKSVLNQVKNEQDFQELITVYGVKTTSCGWSDTKGNLLQHLCDENNGGWFNVGESVTELNSILQSKGVTTQIPMNC